MKTNKTIRRIIAMAVIFFAAILSGCQKENSVGPSGSSGSFDERIIGTWQNQEILGSGDVTQTSVVEITFNPDGSGFEESFSIGPFGQTGRKRNDFSWTGKSGNKLHLSFNDAEVDGKFTITDPGDGMRITFANGNKIIYSRLN